MTAQSFDSFRLDLEVPVEARVGSAVRITLRVENLGDQPIDLYLRGRTIAFDVIVRRDSGEIVWRRLENAIIPAVLRIETLPPHGMLELHADWGLETTTGASVTPGTYAVQGVLVTEDAELRTVPVSLHVSGG